jgi:hypothetical protein
MLPTSVRSRSIYWQLTLSRRRCDSFKASPAGFATGLVITVPAIRFRPHSHFGILSLKCLTQPTETLSGVIICASAAQRFRVNSFTTAVNPEPSIREMSRQREGASRSAGLRIVSSLRDSYINLGLPGTPVPGYSLYRPCGTDGSARPQRAIAQLFI